MGADARPAPLSPGLLKVLRAVDRLGAHDALMAVQPDIVAIEAEQHPETVKHLLNRLHGHGMLDRAIIAGPGERGWSWWLTTQGLAEARKPVPS